MEITFEGKIKVKENVSAKSLLSLLHFLTEEKGFLVKKYKADEVKLTKTEVIEDLDAPSKKQGKASIEVEIEVSQDSLEIEVESSNLEIVKNLTTELAARL